MPKWISPLFTDIRNALGESVVFSNWKGRGYFRGYAKPANPNTVKQQAHRELMKVLVARWKEIATTDAIKQAWNDVASPEQISGYNLFVKEGRKSEISVPSSASGTGSATITVTYTLGLGAADARIYRYDGTTWVDVTPAGGLSAGANQTFDDTVTASGTYTYFIADGRVLVSGDTAPQAYQAISKWSLDLVNGTVVEATCTATVT